MHIRYYIDPATELPHIYQHDVSEQEVEEVEEVLRRPGEDRPGREGPPHRPSFRRSWHGRGAGGLRGGGGIVGQVGQNLMDDLGVVDTGDDLQRALAVGIHLDVDVKDRLHALGLRLIAAREAVGVFGCAAAPRLARGLGIICVDVMEDQAGCRSVRPRQGEGAVFGVALQESLAFKITGEAKPYGV